jgi:hypothetical protein
MLVSSPKPVHEAERSLKVEGQTDRSIARARGAFSDLVPLTC